MHLGALVILSLARPCWAACGDTEQDRLVWARERMHPSADRRQIELIYQWLLNATRSCTSNGDLWYYRGLLAKQMHDQRDADYSFQKAADNHSQEQQSHFDPFLVVNHASVTAPGVIREKYALVIGVSDFPNSDDFLMFSSKDAQAFRDFLVQSANFKQENVKLLVDREATTDQIRQAFGFIHEKAKADDLVLVYISSHGLPRKDDPTGLSYVETYDTDTRSSGKVFASALKMVELAELGRWVLAHDYVLLLDTCYSGEARAGGTQVNVPGSSTFDPLQGLAGSGNRVVISASRANERSYEDPSSKHGYFTRFLLEALKNPSAQPVSSVFEYLRGHISSEVAQVDNRQQHPEMQAYGQGQQIVLNAPVSADLKLFQVAGNHKGRASQAWR